MKLKLIASLALFCCFLLMFSSRPFKGQAQIFSLLPSNLTSGDIATVIGGDRAFGDGELAVQASLNSPSMAIFDKAGNILVADTSNHRIRKIDLTSGKITTIAGNGKPGFTGDAEPAITAGLNFPTGIALDQRGALFITDSGNNRIRRVDPDSSVITTVAGNGNAGQDKDNVEAIETTLTNPFSLTIDKSGNLYTLQLESFRIRRIDASSKMISTIGSGRPGISRDGENAITANLIPVAIAISNQDNLLIVETNAMPQIDNILISNRIRQVDSQTGLLSTLAGNGCNPFRMLNCTYNEGEIAAKTSLIFPLSVTTDKDGNLFISDDNKIKRVDVLTGAITTIAGSGIKTLTANNGDGGLATNATIFPTNLLVDKNNNIFIVDNAYDQVRRIDATTSIISSLAGIGIGDGNLANKAKLFDPKGLDFDKDGNLFIADSLHNLIRKVDSRGKITTVAGTGRRNFNGDGKLALETDLNEPLDVAIDNNTGNLFIVEPLNRVRMLDAKTNIISTIAGKGLGGFSGDGGLASNATLSIPTAITVDAQGNLFIADTANNRIRRVDVQSGKISTIAGNGQLAFSGDEGQAINAGLASPRDLALDNKNNLIVIDDSNRIRSINLGSGIITTIAGSGKIGFKGDGKTAKKAIFNNPRAITIDKDNNIFIADSLNNRIRKIDANTGIITSIAGDGMDKSTGDNGPAISASISMPTNITVDKEGNLFIADKRNDVIRAIKGK
ncbi:MAG: hypothetical protein HY819_21945 [Acidobacteria bacterium]|nr:hypothetical protein [Acidobacteriota bacterium]